MKKLLLLVLIQCWSINAFAELTLDDFNLMKAVDNVTDMEGWTPRYAFVTSDVFLGITHYTGLSFFKRKGAIYEGPTLRVGFGRTGQKINLSFTSGFSFMSVDMGLSYFFLDTELAREFNKPLEVIGLELGLRLWVVQFIAVHAETTSFISLAYGF